MKKKICLLLSVAAYVFANAQKINTDVLIGDDFKAPKGSPDFILIYSDSKETIGIRSSEKIFGTGVVVVIPVTHFFKSEKTFIERYDDKMKLVKSVPLNDVVPEGQDFCGSVILAGKIYFFLRDAQKSNISLSLTEFDKSSVRLIGTSKNLGEFAGIDSKKDVVLKISFSPDSSRILFALKKESYDESTKKAELKIFDNSFTFLWGKHVEIPVDKRESKIVSQDVSNTGDVVLVTKHNWEKKEAKKKAVAFFHSVLWINKSSQLDMNMPLEGMEIISVAPFFTKDRLILHGFSCDKGDWTNWDRANSTYLLTYKPGSATPEKTKLHRYTSDTETLVDFTKPYNPDLLNAQGENMFMKYRYYFPNGDCLFITEPYTEIVGDQRIGQTTYKVFTQHYGNIVFTYLTTEGELKYCKRVYRNQKVSGGSFYTNFSACRKDSKVYVFFNDLETNKHNMNSAGGEVRKFSNSTLVVASIDPDGVIQKNECISNSNLRTILMPEECKSLTPGELVIFGSRFNFLAKNDVQLGKIIIR